MEFSSTPGGQHAYSKYLYRVPIACSINYSTRNLDFLESNDFLGNDRNRVLMKLTERPFVE